MFTVNCAYDLALKRCFHNNPPHVCISAFINPEVRHNVGITQTGPDRKPRDALCKGLQPERFIGAPHSELKMTCNPS